MKWICPPTSINTHKKKYSKEFWILNNEKKNIKISIEIEIDSCFVQQQQEEEEYSVCGNIMMWFFDSFMIMMMCVCKVTMKKNEFFVIYWLIDKFHTKTAAQYIYSGRQKKNDDVFSLSFDVHYILIAKSDSISTISIIMNVFFFWWWYWFFFLSCSIILIAFPFPN